MPMSHGAIRHQPQPLPHHRHANSKNEPSWQRSPLPKIVPPWKATDDVLGSMDSVCALFYVFYWVFPRAKSEHTSPRGFSKFEIAALRALTHTGLLGGNAAEGSSQRERERERESERESSGTTHQHCTVQHQTKPNTEGWSPSEVDYM